LKIAVGIIPARYASQRYPGKSLARIQEKPMIQWVYEGARSAKLLDRVIVATDDERIYQACQAFGAEAMMTSPDHMSGTERAAEIAEKMEHPIIINIQGDEPLIRGDMLDSLVKALKAGNEPMATLAVKNKDLSIQDDPNIVKTVIDKNSYALYFSRSPLPYHAEGFVFQHIGIYGYQRDFLLKFCQLGRSRLERAEKLEQLRVLENGYKIKVVETQYIALSVDTAQDIIKVEKFLEKGIHD
jgi:3-deoxy-manno-octulosonate cytidylyltransferase (CMP-KDO synthetase)